jgi:RNA polymerase sigma-70 factor (ECF subfamily)
MMLTFNQLYETHAEDVYRFSLWVTGDKSEAEDITSETFIRAWSKLSKLRTETLKAYLFAIARNIYLQKIRDHQETWDLDPNLPDPSPGPVELIEVRAELQQIQELILTLPEMDRAAFVMRVQHDCSYYDISRVLGISLSSSKVKVHRTRKKIIRAFLGKE